MWWNKSFENQIWQKERYCQVANKAAEFVRLLSVSWNPRGDAATSWSDDRRFGLWDIELSVCRVSNRRCVRFVSSIPLKSMQRIKAWKVTLRLRAYNETLLQQIGNSGNFGICRLTLITADLICMFCVWITVIGYFLEWNFSLQLYPAYIHRGPWYVPAIHTVRLRFRGLTLRDLD